MPLLGTPRPRQPTSLRSAVILLLSLVSAGCYTFRPAAMDEIGPGQDVRMRVTGAFADSLGPLVMRPDARVFEGTVVADAPGSLMLDIPVPPQVGVGREVVSQRVEVPEDAFVDLELKELSRARSVGVAALIGAAGAVIVIAQFSGDSGGADRPGTGQPVESIISIPLVDVPMRIARALLGR